MMRVILIFITTLQFNVAIAQAELEATGHPSSGEGYPNYFKVIGHWNGEKYIAESRRVTKRSRMHRILQIRVLDSATLSTKIILPFEELSYPSGIEKLEYKDVWMGKGMLAVLAVDNMNRVLLRFIDLKTWEITDEEKLIYQVPFEYERLDITNGINSTDDFNSLPIMEKRGALSADLGKYFTYGSSSTSNLYHTSLIVLNRGGVEPKAVLALFDNQFDEVYIKTKTIVSPSISIAAANQQFCSPTCLVSDEGFAVCNFNVCNTPKDDFVDLKKGANIFTYDVKGESVGRMEIDYPISSGSTKKSIAKLAFSVKGNHLYLAGHVTSSTSILTAIFDLRSKTNLIKLKKTDAHENLILEMGTQKEGTIEKARKKMAKGKLKLWLKPRHLVLTNDGGFALISWGPVCTAAKFSNSNELEAFKPISNRFVGLGDCAFSMGRGVVICYEGTGSDPVNKKFPMTGIVVINFIRGDVNVKDYIVSKPNSMREHRASVHLTTRESDSSLFIPTRGTYEVKLGPYGSGWGYIRVEVKL